MSGHVAIERLSENDIILTVGTDGKISSRPINKIFKYENVAILAVDTDAGTLRTTREHPLWMGGELYQPAGELKSGDVVMAVIDGKIIPTTISGLREESANDTVYNLEVDAASAYIADGIIVEAITAITHKKKSGNARQAAKAFS